MGSITATQAMTPPARATIAESMLAKTSRTATVSRTRSIRERAIMAAPPR
jgi:hypothetical protein